jgi:hypothetical protein
MRGTTWIPTGWTTPGIITNMIETRYTLEGY